MPKPVSLLFFTYADRRYDMFAVPYVYFALRNNPEAICEISLEDAASFHERYASAISVLDEFFPGRFYFRQSCTASSVIPNTVRFIEQPEMRAPYVYIGDIDLLVFDDVAAVHLALMAEHGLSFSNIVRAESVATEQPRLSGLHFCAWDLIYPLPDLSDLDFARVNDEHVLYEIMRRKGALVPLSFQLRPECGIHMSLSRDPAGRSTGAASGNFTAGRSPGWSGRRYYARLLHEIQEESFCRLMPHLHLEFRLLLLTAEALARGQMRQLHRTAAGFLLDRRLLVPASECSVKQLVAERHKAIQAGDFATAEALGATALLLWPNRVEIWFKQAWLWMSEGKVALVVEALAHICELPSGIEFLQQSGFVRKHAERLREAGVDGVDVVGRVGVAESQA